MSFKAIHARLKGLSRSAAAIGGFGIIAISVMITIDVLLRKFVGTTLGGATEVSSFIFAVATSMAYPYVLLDRANIRIDVIYTHVSPRLRAILDLSATIFLVYFVSLLTYSVFQLALKSWHGNTQTIGVLTMPLWAPQILWVTGYILLTLTGAFLLLYATVQFARRDWAGVVRLVGVPNIEEIIEEEVHIEQAGPASGAGRDEDAV